MQMLSLKNDFAKGVYELFNLTKKKLRLWKGLSDSQRALSLRGKYGFV